MTASRGQRILLVGGFLAMISAVGVGQAIIEIRRGEPVQALNLFREAPSVGHLRSFESQLEEASWFAGTLRPIVAYGRFRLFDDTGAKALRGRDDWWFYRPSVRYLIEPVPERTESDHGLAAAAAAILDFRDQLAAMGIALLVVPVPGKASVYPDRLTRRLNGPLTAGPTPRLIADLERAGVDVVNLFDVFAGVRSHADAANPLYLPQDTHWSPEGMRLAAEATARKLLELGLVERGQVQYDLKPVAVKRRGDIVRMMQAPRIERCFPAETIDCTQVVHRQSGEVYRDDPDSQILVLGDSFLRIYEQDAPGSGGMIAHLARELGFPLASLVNDGGASTLVRQALARKPALLANKRVVVWEFIERDIRFGMEGWPRVPLPAERQPGVAAAMLE